MVSRSTGGARGSRESGSGHTAAVGVRGEIHNLRGVAVGHLVALHLRVQRRLSDSEADHYAAIKVTFVAPR